MATFSYEKILKLNDILTALQWELKHPLTMQDIPSMRYIQDTMT